ncbi:hypothetical protein O3M35_010019 [Rhynocoris fuscipes]|uniref:SP-RING-type domain-containing protein n=1 Tax=Rhynocoris fuscipes TaxID=488301 RepID=A0AAW1CXE0_9HEMI
MYSINTKSKNQAVNSEWNTLENLILEKIEKLNRRDSLEIVDFIKQVECKVINGAKKKIIIRLTDDQVLNIIRHRTGTPRAPSYYLQLLLRIGMLTSGGDIVRFENINKNFTVKCNNKEIRNPEERPINLTPALKILPQVDNIIVIEFHRNSFYVVQPYLAKEYSSPAYYSPSLTFNPMDLFSLYTKIISESKKLNEANVDDAEIISYDISLICPITQTQIKCPCRGEQCYHLNCFDLTAFLKLYLQKRRWFCPICAKLIKPNTLFIDRFTKKLISQVPEDCLAVTINQDGTWFPKITNRTV